MPIHKFPKKKAAPQSQRGKTPMDVALKYLSPRARSVREMELHLDEQQYGEFEVQQVVDRLIELGYLDDRKFADDFIQSRLASKPVSRNKLREQLHAHQIPGDIIEEALTAFPDEEEYENALRVARKYAPQLSALEPAQFQQRLYRRIAGRGFSFEDAKRATLEVMEEISNEPYS